MTDKQMLIKELKKQAEHVKQLSKNFRKRRPVVIEFSGSPKAGKTSSITSLVQFLKRNDFKVKVIQEAASICPVIDKHSPMFNLWTLCNSIASLVGVMESDTGNLDVVIIDRGIYDAMCWFQWLDAKGKIEKEMLHTIQEFIIIDRLIRYVDIVFSFSADPQTSIDREYANLLTDVRGSIMNEDTLQAYREAMETTYREKGKFFRKIIKIDTTNKQQNDVGKEVTKETLKSLEDLFDESVGCFRVNDEIGALLQNKSYILCQELDCNQINLQFQIRNEIEKDDNFIQPIPIAVFADGNRVLLVKKTDKAASNGSPEHKKTLAYVGGHIRKEDKNQHTGDDFIKLCKTALHREIEEELGISISLDGIIPNYIYVKDHDKSKRHLAVCFMVRVKEGELHLRMKSNELISNKNSKSSGVFKEVDRLEKLDMDGWSKNIIRYCFNKEIVIAEQITLELSK